MTVASKRHLDRVAQLPCAVCGASGVQVHHLREGQGMGQRSGYMLTIPLCPEHHTGRHGIHGDRLDFKLQKKDEMTCLEDTLQELYG